MLMGKDGRTSVYLAIERGLLEVLDKIVECNIDFDFNVPVTSEFQKYRPVHVAARYTIHLTLVSAENELLKYFINSLKIKLLHLLSKLFFESLIFSHQILLLLPISNVITCIPGTIVVT